MHIQDMLRTGTAGRRSTPTDTRRSHPWRARPVALDVVLDAPVVRAQHLLEGVRRIKSTPWYRLLRRRGLQFVPLGYQHGRILLAVGTAASLGAAYVVYKRIQQTRLQG